MVITPDEGDGENRLGAQSAKEAERCERCHVGSKSGAGHEGSEEETADGQRWFPSDSVGIKKNTKSFLHIKSLTCYTSAM